MARCIDASMLALLSLRRSWSVNYLCIHEGLGYWRRQGSCTSSFVLEHWPIALYPLVSVSCPYP